MGTRHLIAVQLDGEYKIAQYGQWDGYPDGQGKEVVNFIKNKMNRVQFEEKLREVKFLTKEETERINKACDEFQRTCDGLLDFGWYSGAFPMLTRDAGAKILERVQHCIGKPRLINQIDFAGDSLFCEFAYVIDLDKNVLEFYKGFNTEPVPAGERFEKARVEVKPNGQKNEYYPIRLVHGWTFDEIKACSVKSIVDEMNEMVKEPEDA